MKSRKVRATALAPFLVKTPDDVSPEIGANPGSPHIGAARGDQADAQPALSALLFIQQPPRLSLP